MVRYETLNIPPSPPGTAEPQPERKPPMITDAQVEAAVTDYLSSPRIFLDDSRMKAAMRAALEAAEAAGWQDISTAPRDRPIQLYRDGEQCVAQWMTAIEDQTGEWIIFRQLGINGRTPIAVRFPEPTRWRPLPAPPAAP